MDEKTEMNSHDWDGCLMCAVRALTLGTPKTWGLMKAGKEMQPGDSITGVVVRKGEQPSHYEARVPYLDLWLGGIERVRVAGHGQSLRAALESTEADVGDTVTVVFDGTYEFKRKGTNEPATMRKFSAEVRRGHH